MDANARDEEIRQKIAGVVTGRFGEKTIAKAGGIKPGTNFKTDLNADSLDAVELVMELEEAFDIEIPDEEAERIKTLNDIYILVARKLEEKRRATEELRDEDAAA